MANTYTICIQRAATEFRYPAFFRAISDFDWQKLVFTLLRWSPATYYTLRFTKFPLRIHYFSGHFTMKCRAGICPSIFPQSSLPYAGTYDELVRWPSNLNVTVSSSYGRSTVTDSRPSFPENVWMLFSLWNDHTILIKYNLQITIWQDLK